MINPYDQGEWSFEHFAERSDERAQKRSQERSQERSLERSLEHKLKLLADGEDMQLTPEEAAVYGADYADEWEQDEDADLTEEDDHD